MSLRYTLIQVPIFVKGLDGNEIQNQEYSRIINDYLDLIKEYKPVSGNYFIGGMPVTMESVCSKQLLRLDENNKFVNYLTLKVDGERYLLFLSSWGELFFIDRLMNFYIFINSKSSRLPNITGVGRTLIDGEMIIHSKTDYEFFIFDLLFYNSESFISKNYYTRYDVCKFVNNSIFIEYLSLNTNPDLNIAITLKRWFPITEILKTDDIYKYIDNSTNEGRLVKNKLSADGLIIQSFDTPYITFGPWIGYNNVQFKWKPPEHQTMDFKIKITGNNWELLTKSDLPFTLPGSGIKATCKPTAVNKRDFVSGDVAEFKYSIPKRTFVIVRSRPNKQANSQEAIRSVLRFISNPFSLDLLKPALLVLTGKSKKFSELLKVMSKSQLILCSVSLFFVNSKNKNYNELLKLKEIHSMFLKNGSKNMELEARLYKNGNPKQNMDKFTFNYLFEFLILNFQMKKVASVPFR